MADDDGPDAELAALREHIDLLVDAIENADLDALDQVSIWHDLAERASVRRQDWVSEARVDGCTWEEIGAALDTSRQAAQQRYGRAVKDR